ncbi:uncharacterized protein LOC129552617 isoform X1 [Moschus berezovskii]|uniref:uncharacterized protein LOC129552617 isoform X1 n=1 Tax=Moschus berezovskii TaxID=68408 RepID=UPI0024448210|nr:uncharacterized protein LOC129552617 isoform X1 [Moschus berezovskii]
MRPARRPRRWGGDARRLGREREPGRVARGRQPGVFDRRLSQASPADEEPKSWASRAERCEAAGAVVGPWRRAAGQPNCCYRFSSFGGTETGRLGKARERTVGRGLANANFRSVPLRALSGLWEENSLVRGRSVLIAAALGVWHLKVKLGHVGSTHFFFSSELILLGKPPRIAVVCQILQPRVPVLGGGRAASPAFSPAPEAKIKILNKKKSI